MAIDRSTQGTATLDQKKLDLAIDYIKKLDRQVTEREDELAKRMGIDPDKDLLIMPTKVLTKIHGLPKWIHVTDLVSTPYLIRGMRDKHADHS